MRQLVQARPPVRVRRGLAQEPRGFGTAVTAASAAGHDFARISVSAPVQRRAQGDAPAGAIRGTAREGVRGPGAPLPFAERIQRAFGRHAVQRIRAHFGPAAARTTDAMRADAFAHGDHVVFGAAPTLHLAAHEAAHVVQQRAGARPAGGISREGDALERHADAVAARVAAGASAEPLLDRVPGAAAGASAQAASAAAPVQRGIARNKQRQKQGPPYRRNSPKGLGLQHKPLETIIGWKNPDGTTKVVSSSRALRRPHRPQFRNKDVNKAETPMQQPVATVKKADPVPYTLPDDMEKRVDAFPAMTTQGTPKRVDIDSDSPLRQFTGVKLREMGVTLTGGNQGGLYPENKSQQFELPEVADYTERRPEQVLSHISEMMLHSAHAADKEPVETQFGYGRKDKSSPLDLYASTNNKETQELLLEHLKDPVGHVKAAAKSKDPQLQKMALKLLYFEENKQARLKEIGNRPDKERLTKELELASQVHGNFMKGNVNVVVNPHKRHAEQNIADAMHAKGGYTSSDIAGAKIRCEGCSSELGYNLQDDKGRALVGREYASQAESERHKSTHEDIQRGRTLVVTNRSARSRSHSPPRLPKKTN